jgi:hypothetical protein
MNQPQLSQIALRDRHIRVPQGILYLIDVVRGPVEPHRESVTRAVERAAGRQHSYLLQWMASLRKRSAIAPAESPAKGDREARSGRVMAALQKKTRRGSVRVSGASLAAVAASFPALSAL